MTSDKSMNKLGRPKIELDWNKFAELCEHQDTLAGIAAAFDCSEDTIERRVQEHFGHTFADVSTDLRQVGKTSLRRKQYEIAMAGNVRMLIHLGKHWLGQKGKPENKQQEVHLHFDKQDEGL